LSSVESSLVAVVAEKPSVARDIARVLRAEKSGEGFLQGNGYVVTWAIGHLVSLPQPHEIDPRWRRWSRELLPMLPRNWPLTIYDKTKSQFEIVQKILRSPRVQRVVCATDAGREGELIFRYIYEATDCEKPVDRLWISSLTPEAIQRGFENLRPANEYDPLGQAAIGRSRADWLVGMNLSRAYSLTYNEDLSVGRVQTPTLAMIVERDLAIRNFVPQDYIEIEATFSRPDGDASSRFKGLWFRTPDERAGGAEAADGKNPSRLNPDGKEAERIGKRVASGEAQIVSVDSQTQRTPPPLLYDLTDLQRHANRLYGFSAQKTLELAQALYEKHKLISYPRTDSRHLSRDVAATLPAVVKAIAAPYQAQLAPGTGERVLGRRFVDDAKVSDHHAIIPNAVSSRAALPADERKVYDMICRRLLSAWQTDHVVAVTTVITAVTSPDATDLFRSSGSVIDQMGWKVLDPATERPGSAKSTKEDEPETTLPAGLAAGQQHTVEDVRLLKRKTRAPKSFTEASLLTAMETAGKTLDEKELSEAMRETGLGTPATRASIIETLLKREYVIRQGKLLKATDKGIHLIEVVHPEVKSPAMTGQWEAYLKRVEHRQAELQPFLEGIEEYVRAVIQKAENAPIRERKPVPTTHSSATAPPVPIAALGPSEGQPSSNLLELLQRAFSFSSFRPSQERVCQAVADGSDVLLVMPTGAGKSICYQLPGLARGGTTLVISPLIALIEDQVAILRKRGLSAEAIHSGRDRATSRQVCLDYLAGRLQFLFVAPERFKIAGFAEMLARRKPNLIAIDEAHCISQWGHDFRPDYRMLGQHLPLMRPAPVIALTATATPQVQHDICQQLKLPAPSRFVHGFRRHNIAIEVVERRASERLLQIEQVLSDSDRRPAIVYAPTRKKTEELAAELKRSFGAAAYHAGLDSEHRREVQEQFIEGKTEVIVATVAFGMGIDKPNVRTVIHTGLPGSLEGYYQEIGRAGRDGLPSRALLMHSYADRHTHDFFLDRDYPEVSVLDRIYGALNGDPVEKGKLQKRLKIDPDLFDKALEKLWIHGGAKVDYEDRVGCGEKSWRSSYLQQTELRSSQIEHVLRFASTNACRMATLVGHFGDVSDRGVSCGLCDFCAPEACIAQRFRTPTEQERAAMDRVLAALRSGGPRGTGKLYAELFPGAEMTRNEFENLLGAAVRSGLISQAEEVFEKDGKRIPYRTVRLTPITRAPGENGAVHFVMKDDAPAFEVAVPKKRKKKASAKRSAAKDGKQVQRKTKAESAPASRSGEELEKALKEWRLKEAKRRGVPAFRIFTDRVLTSMMTEAPQTTNQLSAISGVPTNFVKQYGDQICAVIRQHAS
jgi:DNA topoisomerase-3